MNIEICINPNCQRADDATKYRPNGLCRPCWEYKRTHNGEDRPLHLTQQAARRAAAAGAKNEKINMAEARRRDPHLNWFLNHIRKAGNKTHRKAVTA